MQENNIKPISNAIIIAGILIAGAILLKGSSAPRDLSMASPVFNQCLESGKYSGAVTDSKTEGENGGVSGTPKGFILSGGNLVATIDGAEPLAMVKQKIDKALTGTAPTVKNTMIDPSTKKEVSFSNPAPVSSSDFTLGNPNAKITLIMYEDFQCPFCGKFFKESEQSIRDTYVKNGDVQLVYRDYAFLGPESLQAAEAARCAADQGKFWEYHDYLFSHQMGENQGAFANTNLKTFAGTLKLK